MRITPLVDRTRLKGNFGANYVAAVFSTQCLVRPVAVDTDVGIDLYCETLTNGGIPFQHFWLQVKAGESIKVRDGIASYRFDPKQLDYWSYQPVPVFAALVPTDW